MKSSACSVVKFVLKFAAEVGAVRIISILGRRRSIQHSSHIGR